MSSKVREHLFIYYSCCLLSLSGFWSNYSEQYHTCRKTKKKMKLFKQLVWEYFSYILYCIIILPSKWLKPCVAEDPKRLPAKVLYLQRKLCVWLHVFYVYVCVYTAEVPSSRIILILIYDHLLLYFFTVLKYFSYFSLVLSFRLPGGMTF